MTFNGFSFNGVHSSEFPVLVNRINRSMAPDIEERLITVPNRSGAYDFGTNLGVRRFSIEITATETDRSRLLSLLNDLNEWLIQKELCSLILDEESDREYFARLTGSTSLDGIFSVGFVTLEFVCPDPYGYALEETVVTATTTDLSNGSIDIMNNGKAEAYPTIRAKFKTNADYFSIVSKDSHIFIGDDVKVESSVVPIIERVFWDEMTDVNLWTTGTTIDGGVVAGSMASNGYHFYPTGYGEGTYSKQWHGATLKRSIGQEVQDFKVDASIVWSSSSKKQVGRLEIYLLDINGAVIGKMSMRDGHNFENYGYVEFRAGRYSGGKYFGFGKNIIAGTNPWAQFNGSIRIWRVGNKWGGWLGRWKPEAPYWSSRAQFEFEDVDNKYLSKLAQVQIHFGAYDKYDPYAYPQIQDLKVYKYNYDQLSGDDMEGSIFVMEDDLLIDNARANVTSNGQTYLEKLDPSSDFFPLEKGGNTLAFTSDNIESLEVRFRERYL